MQKYNGLRKLFSFGIIFSLILSYSFPLITLAVTTPVTVVLPATQDAYIDENPTGATVTFGTSTELSINTVMNVRRRILARFDLSTIPKDATITSASLILFMTTAPASDRVYNVYHIDDGATGTDWSENTVTWDLQPKPSPLTSTTPVVSSTTVSATGANSDVSWDVTADVQKMLAGTAVNQGWKIADSVEDTPIPSILSIFKSKEGGGASQGPRLSITYTQPGATSTASISGTVFNDLNGDGVLGAGETGLSGWTVNLSGNTASTTVTNSSGQYSFNGVSDGVYNVCEVISSTTPSFVQTSPTSGFACPGGTKGSVVTIASSTNATNINFGNLSDVALPVSTIISPLASSTVSAEFVSITGTSTDNHAVSSVALFFSQATSTSTTTPNDSCGTFSPITTLTNASSTSPYNWSFNWTPTTDGTYCLKAAATDSVGNVESASTTPIVKNVTFTKTTPPPPPPPPAPAPTGGGIPANGPIVGSLTSSSFGPGLALGGSVVPTAPTPSSPGVTMSPAPSSSGSENLTPTVGEGPSLAYGGTSGGTTNTQRGTASSGNQETVIAQNPQTSTTTSTISTTTTSDQSNQLAQVATSTSFFTLRNSLLVILFIIIIGGVIFLAVR